jgi:hypothetical protein
MNEKQINAIDKAFSEFGISKQILIGNKKQYSSLLKQRICELKRMGVKVQLISDKFQVPKYLIYKWYYSEQKNHKGTSLKPKQLKLKKNDHPTSLKNNEDFNEDFSKKSYARLIFKSGVQLELPFAGLDQRFLNLINEVGV